MSTISVIVLNYNSSADCCKCVADLQRQEGVELEIIIVDNCSRTEDALAVEKLAAEQGCTFIAAKENRGYNAGNNIGLRYAANKGYEYALIANPDMEFPQRDYVYSLAKKLEDDPMVAVVGSDISNPSGLHQNPLREIAYWEELLWPIVYIRNYKSRKWYTCNHEESGYCEKVSGCCMMICISFLDEINFFDENVFLYSEEAILAKQVKTCGRRIYFLADAMAFHNHICNQKGDSKKRMRVLYKSRNYYLRKYSGYKGVRLHMLLFSRRIQYYIRERL